MVDASLRVIPAALAAALIAYRLNDLAVGQWGDGAIRLIVPAIEELCKTPSKSCARQAGHGSLARPSSRCTFFLGPWREPSMAFARAGGRPARLAFLGMRLLAP